ncbi:hypothetical protein DY000_02026623 [Brassica cretica]|uniref:Uncharacterized protein n=1 Tax=Brassica cretica TaxID=69181 RepID=A0ABQ7EHP7_BRACR|nr:hypothetical protein DY000_02026623 [Brassica cretica]
MTVLSLTLPSFPLSYALPSTAFKSRASPPLIITASSSPSRRPELKQDRRRSIKAMSRDISSPDLPQVMELVDESDFEKLISSENRISITGFGSLLSERSARSTFPDLENFRVAKLQGFRRVFAHAAPIFFERGIANLQTKEISSLSVEPCEGESLVVTVFEIKQTEIPAFIQRELEFRFLAVVPETLQGNPFTYSAVLCGRYSDEEFFRIRCKGNKEVYFQHYGRFNIDKIWRDDIFPCRLYLRHCVLAAKNLGDEAYNNFLDHTFLGDRRTTIREYLSSTGSGIMEEEPPEALKSRYGERSARSTFPDLENFRVAKLQGFRRVFAHSAPIFFERGIANLQTKEISSLSVEPCEGENLVVSVFEINQTEIPAFIQRELEFRFLAVVPETLQGKPFTHSAVLCGRYSDEEFFQIRCKGNKEVYFQHYRRFNIDKIWRDDIFPCRLYLRHCVLAAKNLGDEAYNNFLDHTYLGDRRTTIRKYLSSKGSGIMEEEPPEALKSRYGG